MNFLIENWLLVLAALTSGGLLLWPQLSGATAGGNAVGTAEAVRLINREKALLIDVSEPAEYAAGHPAGARNVPLAQIAGHKALPSNKSLPLVVTASRSSSATRAAAALRQAGYEKVLTLAGGVAAWREANLPIDKSA